MMLRSTPTQMETRNVTNATHTLMEGQTDLKVQTPSYLEFLGQILYTLQEHHFANWKLDMNSFRILSNFRSCENV